MRCRRRERSPTAEAPLSLLWLSQESAPKRSVLSQASMPEHSLRRRTAPPDTEPPGDVVTPESSNAITLPSDLSAEAEGRGQQLDLGATRRAQWAAGGYPRRAGSVPAAPDAEVTKVLWKSSGPSTSIPPQLTDRKLSEPCQETIHEKHGDKHRAILDQ